MGVALRRYFYERVPFKLGGSAAPVVLFWLLLLFSLNRFISPGRMAAAELLTIAVLFPLLLLIVAGATPGRRIAAICKWSGDASYPVYLLQVPFMGVVAGVHQLFWGINAPIPVPGFGIAHVLGTIACALCIDRFYELPLRKYLKDRWQRFKESPVSSTTSGSVDVH